MPSKLLTKDNPVLPTDYNTPTDEDKRKVYTFDDGEITIDSQVHIYDEIPTGTKAEDCLTAVVEWLPTTEQYKENPTAIADFYTRKQLFRFCRARQFDIEKTKTMILENIVWRAEQTPHLLKFKGDLERHAQTGKTHLRPERDQYGRPVVVLHNHYNNSQEFDIGAQLTFYTLEKSARWMNEEEEGPSHHVVILNMEHFSYSSQPPMDVAKKVGYALSHAYAERLGNVIIYSAPWLFRAFYATISGLLLDDRTRSKVVFIKDSDKQLEGKMEFILGPNWKQLTGIGGEQPDPKVAPGFDPVRYADWCNTDDETRFATEVTPAPLETKVSGEVAAEQPTTTPTSTTEAASTTTTTTTTEAVVTAGDSVSKE